MPNPIPTIADLERNDLQGTIAIFEHAIATNTPVNSDTLRVLRMLFDDSGSALIAELKSRNLLFVTD